MSANVPELVIREITPGIIIFSRPFNRFNLIPLGGRSTAIKLASGDVWVLASTPLTIDAKTAIDGLGPVKYLVSPDIEHHLFLAPYKKAYPAAKVIGVEGLADKKKKEGLKVDGSIGADPEGTTYGYEDEIKAHYFPGHANKEIAFLHIPSKTLVVGDLIFNLPATESYSKSKSKGFQWFTSLNPYGNLGRNFAGNLTKDPVTVKRDATVVAGWDFERIIMCHGDVIEKDAKKAWTTWYAPYL